MKRLLLSFLCLSAALPAKAQIQHFPQRLTGLKGFSRCKERSSYHLKGRTGTIPRLQAIHYFDKNGNDTAVQKYLDDATLAERMVIRYSDYRITSYRKYGGTTYDDTSDSFDPTLLQSTTTYEYRDSQLVHILTTSADGATIDQYLTYDSLGRIKKELNVSHADMVTYNYKVKGKEVTVDRDTTVKDYSYRGQEVVERISGMGRPGGSYTYTYDEKGRLLKQVFRQSSGKIMQTTSHSYDDQGRLSETNYQDVLSNASGPGLPFTKSINSYDREGRLAEQINHTRRGMIRTTYQYER